MVDNPYSPTFVDNSADKATQVQPNVCSGTLSDIAKRTFLAWERLRILFVFVLGLLTLLMSGLKLFELDILLPILACGVFANICYFAGPIVESYIRWLGYEGKFVRWFLFIGGTILTGILAVKMLTSILSSTQM